MAYEGLQSKISGLRLSGLTGREFQDVAPA